MKKTLFVILVIGMVLYHAGMAAALDRGHAYVHGIITDVGNAEIVLSGDGEPLRTQKVSTITLDGSTYTVDPKCRVAIQYFDRGAYHEKEGRFYDVSRGRSVYAKKIGTVVHEILIEGWK